MGHKPRKIRLLMGQCAGDAVAVTAVVRDVMRQYPGRFQFDYHGYHGPSRPHLQNQDENNIFAWSPYITPMGPDEGRAISCDYSGKNDENINGNVFLNHHWGIQEPHREHFIRSFHSSLGYKLGIQIDFSEFKPDIHMSEAERELFPGLPERYAVVDSGYKRDFIAKWAGKHKYQEMVNATKDRIPWVQIGSSGDIHPPLDNVINLVGKTNLRQLIQVIYRSAVVVTPVSLPMHLAAGVPTIGAPRPCVVLMGRREQKAWEAYNYHTILGTDGVLKCGEPLGGGCWRNKSVKVDNDDSICRLALQDPNGEWIPECLHRITAEELIHAVSLYL